MGRRTRDDATDLEVACDSEARGGDSEALRTGRRRLPAAAAQGCAALGV